MNVRIGDYEIKTCNPQCYQIFDVMPEGFDNSKSKLGTSSDGRALRPIQKYPTSIKQGVEIIRQLMLKDEDRAVLSDLDGAIARIEELNAEFEETARRIEEAMADGR